MAVNSVRELARRLGLSHTTVSDALRDSPRVKKATKEQVLKAAREYGYRYNPLAGALMSQMRMGSVETFRGGIAVVDLEGARMRAEVFARFHKEVLEGLSGRPKKWGSRLSSLLWAPRGFRSIGSILS